MDTVKSVDEYCAEISQSIISAQFQEKNNQEQIGIGKFQVEKDFELII